MRVRHLKFVVAAGVAAIAVGLAIHLGAPAASPGAFVTWSTAQSPAPDSTAEPALSLIPQPAVSPPADGGLLGGLQEPLGTVLNGLNTETANVAHGEYGLLQEIGDALRSHIQQFLQWVTSRH